MLYTAYEFNRKAGAPVVAASQLTAQALHALPGPLGRAPGVRHVRAACDVHHLVHWAHDGNTDVDNGALLCERHHTKVHHGFRVERQPDGSWRTYRPDGTQIVIGTPMRI